MKNEKVVLSNCPICNEELVIEKLHCKKCGIDITGEFKLSNIAKLNLEQLTFVETFLKCQGSIKAIEKEMGVSYPTVKKLLNEVLTTLGHDQVKEDKEALRRREILEKLANKEITYDEASELLANKEG